MSSRRVITIFALAIWLMIGPVAMAFGGCAVMSAMCEGPCGAGTCTVLAPAISAAPVHVSNVQVAIDTHPLTIPLAGPDHPPPSPFLSA